MGGSTLRRAFPPAAKTHDLRVMRFYLHQFMRANAYSFSAFDLLLSIAQTQPPAGFAAPRLRALCAA